MCVVLPYLTNFHGTWPWPVTCEVNHDLSTPNWVTFAALVTSQRGEIWSAQRLTHNHITRPFQSVAPYSLPGCWPRDSVALTWPPAATVLSHWYATIPTSSAQNNYCFFCCSVTRNIPTFPPKISSAVEISDGRNALTLLLFMPTHTDIMQN